MVKKEIKIKAIEMLKETSNELNFVIRGTYANIAKELNISREAVRRIANENGFKTEFKTKDMQKNFDIKLQELLDNGYKQINNKYFINEHGEVYKRNLKCIKEVKRNENVIGFWTINIGNGYWVYLHKVIAEAFIPNPNGHKYVVAKDHNYKNILLDNLYWGTWHEANSHRKNNGGRKQQVIKSKLDSTLTGE